MDIAVFVLSIVSIVIAGFTLFFVIKGFLKSKKERYLSHGQKLIIKEDYKNENGYVRLRVVNPNDTKKILFNKIFVEYEDKEYKITIHVYTTIISGLISGKYAINPYDEKDVYIRYSNEEQKEFLSGKKVTLLIKYDDEIVNIPYKLQMP